MKTIIGRQIEVPRSVMNDLIYIMAKLIKRVTFLLFIIFHSCMILPDQKNDCMKSYKERPMTKNEQKYIFGFRPKCKNVNIDRINYEYRTLNKFDSRCIEFSNLEYKVYYEEPKSSFRNKEYLENESITFFKNLYSNVLEDSVIFGIESYQIEFRNFKSDRANKGGYFWLIISKNEMAKLNGFYIKKTKSGLKRVSIKKSANVKYDYLLFNPIK